MKFFIDTGDVKEIKEAHAMGLVDGVTTNPSLIAKSGRKYKDVVVEIAEIVDGPISAEVLSTTYDDMMKEARDWHKVHKNVVVKLPLIPDGLKAVRTCAQEGIRTNATLCFSPNQVLLAAKDGASFISPFIGRLDDIGLNGMDVIREIRTIYDNYPDLSTDILAASIRTVNHVKEAAMIGADVATIPPSILKALVKHPLTDAGLTAFVNDWKKTGLTIV